MKTVSIVGDGKLGIDLAKLEVGVAVEALMRVEFHELGKGKVSFQMCVNTGSMDGVVGPLMDGFQKPIDALFFGWGFGGVIVGELSADLFKQVDVFSDVGAVDVSKLLNGLAKGLLSLLREAVVTEEQLPAGTMAIELGGLFHVSDCVSCLAQHE